MNDKKTDKKIDCLVWGNSVVDILVRPVPLEGPIGVGKLIHAEPIEATTGGIVSNSGIALARLGMKVSAFSYVGDDGWAAMLREAYGQAGMDSSALVTHPSRGTSATAVLIDANGDHSFFYHGGASEQMDRQIVLDHLDLFARSRMALLGYYSLLPQLENDLPELLERIRKTGCRTALDSAGAGGTIEPLDRILPHLDVYVPSYGEAVPQSGEKDPEKILDVFRDCGTEALLGVKLGEKGALLSPRKGSYVEIAPVAAPGPLLDTTGAGDSFYAGLLTGLLRGRSAEDAGRLGAAAGACCVTGLGAAAGLRSFEETARLAGL